jgi:hypothetical protein
MPDETLSALVGEATRRGMLKRDPALRGLIDEARRRGMLPKTEKTGYVVKPEKGTGYASPATKEIDPEILAKTPLGAKHSSETIKRAAASLGLTTEKIGGKTYPKAPPPKFLGMLGDTPIYEGDDISPTTAAALGPRYYGLAARAGPPVSPLDALNIGNPLAFAPTPVRQQAERYGVSDILSPLNIFGVGTAAGMGRTGRALLGLGGGLAAYDLAQSAGEMAAEGDTGAATVRGALAGLAGLGGAAILKSAATRPPPNLKAIEAARRAAELAEWDSALARNKKEVDAFYRELLPEPRPRPLPVSDETPLPVIEPTRPRVRTVAEGDALDPIQEEAEALAQRLQMGGYLGELQTKALNRSASDPSLIPPTAPGVMPLEDLARNAPEQRLRELRGEKETLVSQRAAEPVTLPPLRRGGKPPDSPPPPVQRGPKAGPPPLGPPPGVRPGAEPEVPVVAPQAAKQPKPTPVKVKPDAQVQEQVAGPGVPRQEGPQVGLQGVRRGAKPKATPGEVALQAETPQVSPVVTAPKAKPAVTVAAKPKSTPPKTEKAPLPSTGDPIADLRQRATDVNSAMTNSRISQIGAVFDAQVEKGVVTRGDIPHWVDTPDRKIIMDAIKEAIKAREIDALKKNIGKKLGRLSFGADPTIVADMARLIRLRMQNTGRDIKTTVAELRAQGVDAGYLKRAAATLQGNATARAARALTPTDAEQVAKLKGIAAEVGIPGTTDADFEPMLLRKPKTGWLKTHQTVVGSIADEGSPLYKGLREDENAGRVRLAKMDTDSTAIIRRELPDLIKNKKASALVMELGEQAGGRDIDLATAQQALTSRRIRGVTAQRIVDADRFIRQRYNALIDAANTHRRSLGIEPIKKRGDYYTHLREHSAFSMVWDEISRPYGRIVGSTKVPGRATQPYERPRTGRPYKFDAIDALDTYAKSINRELAFNRQIQRYERIDKALQSRFGDNHPTTALRKNLRYQAEQLGGYPSSLLEKTLMENDTFRKFILPAADFLRVKGSRATVGGSISSMFMQPAALAPAIPRVGIGRLMKAAMEEAVATTTRSGALAQEAPHLAARYALSPRIRRGVFQKVAEGAYEAIGAVERQVSETIYRALKATGRAEGKPDPVKWAQEELERMMGGRLPGQMPPALVDRGVAPFVQFMNEVIAANKYMTSDLFKGASGPDKLARTAKLLLALKIMNEGYQATIGRSPLPDPISTAQDIAKAVQDKKLSAGGKVVAGAARGIGEVASVMPGAQTIIELLTSERDKKALFGDTEIGRYPGGPSTARTLRDSFALLGALKENKIDQAKDKAWNIALTLATPAGGMQGKRIVEGIGVARTGQVRVGEKKLKAKKGDVYRAIVAGSGGTKAAQEHYERK